MQIGGDSSNKNAAPPLHLAGSLYVILSFGVILWFAYDQYSKDCEVLAKGTVIEVSVIGRDRVRDNRGGWDYHLSIRLHPPGESPRVLKTGASRRFFEEVSSRKTLKVLYLPKYPRRIILPEDTHHGWKAMLVWGGCMLLAAGAILATTIRLVWIYHRLSKAHQTPTHEGGAIV